MHRIDQTSPSFEIRRSAADALRTLAQSGSLTKSKFAKSPKRASSMSIALYDLSVPTFLQTVNALAGVLDRATSIARKRATTLTTLWKFA